MHPVKLEKADACPPSVLILMGYVTIEHTEKLQHRLVIFYLHVLISRILKKPKQN